MKLYQIFRSEGGWRVCGGVVNGGPIMELSLWYPTRRGAQCASNNKRRLKEKK